MWTDDNADFQGFLILMEENWLWNAENWMRTAFAHNSSPSSQQYNILYRIFLLVFVPQQALILSFHAFLSFSWTIIWIRMLTFGSPIIHKIIRYEFYNVSVSEDGDEISPFLDGYLLSQLQSSRAWNGTVLAPYRTCLIDSIVHYIDLFFVPHDRISKHVLLALKPYLIPKVMELGSKESSNTMALDKRKGRNKSWPHCAYRVIGWPQIVEAVFDICSESCTTYFHTRLSFKAYFLPRPCALDRKNVISLRTAELIWRLVFLLKFIRWCSFSWSRLRLSMQTVPSGRLLPQQMEFAPLNRNLQTIIYNYETPQQNSKASVWSTWLWTKPK